MLERNTFLAVLTYFGSIFIKVLSSRLGAGAGGYEQQGAAGGYEQLGPSSGKEQQRPEEGSWSRSYGRDGPDESGRSNRREGDDGRSQSSAEYGRRSFNEERVERTERPRRNLDEAEGDYGRDDRGSRQSGQRDRGRGEEKKDSYRDCRDAGDSRGEEREVGNRRDYSDRGYESRGSDRSERTSDHRYRDRSPRDRDRRRRRSSSGCENESRSHHHRRDERERNNSGSSSRHNPEEKVKAEQSALAPSSSYGYKSDSYVRQNSGGGGVADSSPAVVNAVVKTEPRDIDMRKVRQRESESYSPTRPDYTPTAVKTEGTVALAFFLPFCGAEMSFLLQRFGFYIIIRIQNPYWAQSKIQHLKIRQQGRGVCSVVDPETYWIRIQELPGSVFRIPVRIRIHTCKYRLKWRQKM